jgi:hypothetical protein
MPEKECTPLRPRWALLPLALAMIGPAARADVSAITPPDKPILGNMLACTIKDDGKAPNVKGCTWTVQFKPGSTVYPAQYQDMGLNGVNFPAIAPGRYLVDCTVGYGGGPNPPPPKALPRAVVTVRPPLSVRLISGLPATLLYTSTNTVMWNVIDAGGNVCGPYLGGMAQESLTNQKNFDGSHPLDTGWIPATPATTFTLQQGRLVDVQWVNASRWGEIKINDTFTFDQELRILFQFPVKDDTLECPLGSHSFTYKKIDDTHWTDSD